MSAPRTSGLRRPRLTRALAPRPRLGLLVAPAGSGKTEVLAQAASAFPGTVAWYRATADDARRDAVLACLEQTLTSALGMLPTGWQTAHDAVHALDRGATAPLLLVIDDFDAIEAEASLLAELLEWAPPLISVLVAARRRPELDLSRLRLAGDVVELGYDDLCFRSWEIERLFEAHFREPLSPACVAELKRRTGGWAAGVTLFARAAHGRSPHERRRLLARLGEHDHVRDYLVRNVVAALPAAEARFVAAAAPLSRLRADVCDELLERGDSSERLAELERRQLVVDARTGDGFLRWHELLCRHMLGEVDDHPPDATDPLDAPADVTRTWWDLLREATTTAADCTAGSATAPQARLVEAVATLLTGRAGDALTAISELRTLDLDLPLAAYVRLVHAASLLLAGERTHSAVEATHAAEAAERSGLPWIVRLARACVAVCDDDHEDEIEWAARAAAREGDAWGEALIALLRGWTARFAGRDAALHLRRAAGGFSALGATRLERCALALAGSPQALTDYADGEVTLARSIVARCPPALRDAGPPVPARVRIRCFGAFDISLDGRSLTLVGAKPRVRQLLRRLAMSPDVPVHREVLMEGLWPEASPVAATRSLHAAISMLRRALEDAGAPATVVRDGHAYRLAGADVDVGAFDRAIAEMRRGGETIEAARRALDLYQGELLAEDGPAEWVVDAREQRRAEACGAAEALAHALLGRGDARGATRACERGLRIDRACDPLWRLTVAAYLQAGDHAAAARAQREYDAVVVALTLSAA
jgi:DNA-binding SARP family transcriptional activator